MNKLVRMRDVQNAIDNLEWYSNGGKVYVRQTELVDAIDSVHAVDAVEVVRCRECVYYKESKLLAPNKFCFRLKDTDGKLIGYNFADEDFCSRGQRREGDA